VYRVTSRSLGALSAAALAACLFVLPARLRAGGTPRSRFVDVTRAAGLSFRYDNDASPEHRYVETTGGGCAFLDYDNDGLLDLFAVQGGPAPTDVPGVDRPRPHSVLYRGLGGGRFEDVTERAGLAVDMGYGQGVSAADYDNDGWTDLLTTAYGGVHLFHNDGGRFREVTRKAGLLERGGPHWATSAAWADYDRDGFLDLFICHYVSWFADNERPCVDHDERRMYCSPNSYAPDRSALYRGRGDGTFEDASERSGLAKHQGRALGAVWLDANGDGWQDLFVANDLSPNWLLHNLRNGKLREIGDAVGVANGPTGLPLSGMGVAAADYNRDGREDLFIANFSKQPRSLFFNGGDTGFSWASSWAGIGDPGQPLLAFGAEALDYDLDGHPDLVVGNGHINRVEKDRRGRPSAAQRQQLLRNLGGGRFAEDRPASGDLERPRVTRGLAVGDFDNDGRPDCLTSGPGEPLALFRNQAATGRHWIGFRLEGTRSNRDALGAKVTLRGAPVSQVQTVRSGSSYCSRSDSRLLFGLGAAVTAAEVEVTWPDGKRESLGRLAADRYYLAVEGSGCKPDPRCAPAAGG
jgi:enediyne biosynthesis protein E4